MDVRQPPAVVLAALVLVLALLAPLRAGAQVEVRLDAERRAALTELPAIDGPDLSLGDLENRVVVVAFFASWCPPCRPEFEHLKQIDKRYYTRGVTVVAVNIFETYYTDDGGRALKAFLADMSPQFPVVGGG